VEQSEVLKERLVGLQTQYSAMSRPTATARELEEARQAAASLRQQVDALRQERDDLMELSQQQERFISDVEARMHDSERKRVKLHNLVQVRLTPHTVASSSLFCRI
jgi:hypothetical protein